MTALTHAGWTTSSSKATKAAASTFVSGTVPEGPENLNDLDDGTCTGAC